MSQIAQDKFSMESLVACHSKGPSTTCSVRKSSAGLQKIADHLDGKQQDYRILLDCGSQVLEYVKELLKNFQTDWSVDTRFVPWSGSPWKQLRSLNWLSAMLIVFIKVTLISFNHLYLSANLSIFKNVNNQCTVIEFVYAGGLQPLQFFTRMQAVHGNAYFAYTTVQDWWRK